jgi:phosphoribosylformylglycinamidine synthase
MDEALASWMKTLEDVFPTVTGKEKTGEAAKIEEKLYDTDTIYICDHKLAQPEVFIPVFPGTTTASTTAQKPLNVQAQR